MLNVAIHDALIAAWDSKYAHNRRRPGEADPQFASALPAPRSPSYPCEYAVAAGAGAAVLAHIFPTEAQRFTAAAEEAARSRVLAGVVYPSDMRAGLEFEFGLTSELFRQSDPKPVIEAYARRIGLIE